VTEQCWSVPQISESSVLRLALIGIASTFLVTGHLTLESTTDPVFSVDGTGFVEGDQAKMGVILGQVDTGAAGVASIIVSTQDLTGNLLSGSTTLPLTPITCP
jgi:hypothetical protein